MKSLALGIAIGLIIQAGAGGGPLPLAFDSAARAVGEAARALGGEGRGILDPYPVWSQPLLFSLRFAPEWLKRAVLNLGLSISLGAPPEKFYPLDAEAFFGAYTARYPDRSYPAIVLGSPDGALVHLAALIGAPLLPDCGLIGARHRIDPDDLRSYLATGAAAMARLAPGEKTELILHYDPIHDRGLVGYAALIRVKLRGLPDCYRRFIARHLAPGGALILAEDRYSWPQFELGPRSFLQIGGLGGLAPEEYLARYPPAGLGEPRPRRESEWGCPKEFADAVRELAAEGGYRLIELPAEHPADYSRLSLRAFWEAGAREGVVLLSSFTTVDARVPVATGIPPLHLPFNTRDSWELARSILAEGGFRKGFLALHPSYDPPPDFVPLEEWKKLGIEIELLFPERFWPQDPYAPFEVAKALEQLLSSYRLPRPLSLSPEELAGLALSRGTSARSPSPDSRTNSTP